jgi:hypothetical protein
LEYRGGVWVKGHQTGPSALFVGMGDQDPDQCLVPDVNAVKGTYGQQGFAVQFFGQS